MTRFFYNTESSKRMIDAITTELLIAYFQCPRKAYLLTCTKEPGKLHEYEQILEQNRLTNQHKYLDILKQNKSDVFPYNVDNLKKGCEILINATLTADGLQADCAILTKVGKRNYEPTIFVGTHSISETDRLGLMFIGYVLTRVQDKPPTMGYIINMDSKAHRIKLTESRKTLAPLLELLQEWTVVPPEEPPVILNKHCPICQFRDQCERIAVQEDNLSRLNGITPKVIRKYEKKGIFTVKQLSYLFKPRKRKKRRKNPPPTTHKIELQALAIRTGKIYLQELPALNRKETELFLDIEGVPDQNLHYLIGVLVCQGNKTVYHPFWADIAEDEETIWREVLVLVNQ